jgi:hypothetical protein
MDASGRGFNAPFVAAEAETPRRARFLALIAVLFAFAQFMFAAHAGATADELLDHAPQTCEFCLAGAVADDPHNLVFEVTAPAALFVGVASPVAGEFIVDGSFRAASPRGPPHA